MVSSTVIYSEEKVWSGPGRRWEANLEATEVEGRHFTSRVCVLESLEETGIKTKGLGRVLTSLSLLFPSTRTFYAWVSTSPEEGSG